MPRVDNFDYTVPSEPPCDAASQPWQRAVSVQRAIQYDTTSFGGEMLKHLPGDRRRLRAALRQMRRACR